MSSFFHPYRGVDVSVTTKHEKTPLIQPAFASLLEIKLYEVSLDTDQLGTFSGEIERSDLPKETAIKKALLGINESGARFGIASEGSISSDFLIPWVQADYEVMVFVDVETDLVISETFTSREIVTATAKVRIGDDLTSLIERADLPRHGVIVRPLNGDNRYIVKGIHSIKELHEAIKNCSPYSPLNQVEIQSDFRAMHSPSRQQNIQTLAEKLARRVNAQCPDCRTPGWGVVDVEKGVPCGDCGGINNERVSREILGCNVCELKTLGKVVNFEIEAAQCQFCNP